MSARNFFIGFLKNAALVAASLVFTLLLCELVLRFAPFVATPTFTQEVSDDKPIMHFKPEADVVYARGALGEIVVRHRTNNEGFLAPVDFHQGANPLCVIGDSYVEAAHVPPDQNMSAYLRSLTGEMVYPIGVSGAPLSQYLVYARWALERFACRSLVFLVIENDFDESMLSYKNSPGFHYFDDSNNGTLRLVPYRVPFHKAVLRQSALASYLLRNIGVQQILSDLVAQEDPDLSTRRIQKGKEATRLFFDGLSALPMDRQNILMVLDGDRRAIYAGENGRQDVNKAHYEDFIAHATKQGYHVLDLHPVFAADYATNHKPFDFDIDYHWSPRGHETAAKAVWADPVFRAMN